jgi:hypothetical protein
MTSVIQNEEGKNPNLSRRCIMSKFFLQMVLSVLVGVSAAIGFSPSVRNEVHKTMGEAKSLAHGMTQAFFHTVKSVNADTEISTEASVESKITSEADVDLNLASDNDRSTEAAVETEVESDADLNLISDKASKKSPRPKIEPSLSAETETEAEAEIETNNVNLDLEHELESTLDLDLGK